MLSIIGYLLYNGGLLWSKKLLGFHQFLYFSFPYNFLRFQHLEKTISKKNSKSQKIIELRPNLKGDISECWVGWLLLVTNTLTKQNHAQNKRANSGSFPYHPVDQVWLKLDIMDYFKQVKTNMTCQIHISHHIGLTTDVSHVCLFVCSSVGQLLETGTGPRWLSGRFLRHVTMVLKNQRPNSGI
jgi:hypothetical protein